MADWHYSAKSSSFGPVSDDDLIKLYKSGGINENTLVWNQSRGGDWIRFREVPELNRGDGPPPLPASAVSDLWVWLFAAVPMIGYFAENIISQETDIDADTPAAILVYFAVYSALVALDSRVIRKSGRRDQVGGISLWVIFVPIYLFVRAKRLAKSQITLAAWVASVTAVIFLSSGQIQNPFGFSASIPGCEDRVTTDYVKELFPQIPLNLAKMQALDVKSIETVSSSESLVSCRATVVATGGTELNVTYTISPKDGQFYYALNLAL